MKKRIAKEEEYSPIMITEVIVFLNISDFFKESKHFSLEEAREEFLEEEYSDEELRIARIQFISNEGN